MSQIVKPDDDPTKTEAERAGHSNGFVGFDKDDNFVHYCHCGAWASYGYGAALRDEKLGQWYCGEHRPPDKSE